MGNKITTIIISIAIILILGILVYAETIGTTKQIPMPTTDKSLLEEKGFNNLPYSIITCDGTNNCTYYITRAGRDYIRSLPTKDIRDAETERNKDIQKYLDESLVMLKRSQSTKIAEGTIEITEK